MIVTCVYVHVKSYAIKPFMDAIIENHRGSVIEPGNLRFDILQQADDPSRFMIYEAYESVEAAAAHKNTSHYLKWRDVVQDLMVEPRQGVRYNIIEPSDRAKW
jgi:autoinducer 2-degrading protein